MIPKNLTSDSSDDCKTQYNSVGNCCKVQYFGIRRINSSTNYKLSINQYFFEQTLLLLGGSKVAISARA